MAGLDPEIPDFVVAGHVTSDLVGDERRAGGTASYAALVAAALGLRVAVVTSLPEGPLDPDPFVRSAPGGAAADYGRIAIHRQTAAVRTEMVHRWLEARREQYVRSRAETLAAVDVPQAVLEAPIALFGPVVWEVGRDLVDAFPRALRGATVQGWLRRLGADGHVEAIDVAAWDPQPLFHSLKAVFLSEEDLELPPPERERVLASWALQVPILAVTRGSAGASIALDGRWHEIAAIPAHEVAGAFLIRYHEAADPNEAARFASAVASFVVEAPGPAGAPGRDQVQARLRACPEICLRPRHT